MIRGMGTVSLYERVGGMEFFVALADRFFAGVMEDPVLLPLYRHGADIEGAHRRLTLFLVQYWGGPTTYLQERGHPRLRARHSPFQIATLEHDHWLVHMRAAIDASGADAAERDELHAYMTLAADAMINAPDPASADPADRGGPASLPATSP